MDGAGGFQGGLVVVQGGLVTGLGGMRALGEGDGRLLDACCSGVEGGEGGRVPWLLVWVPHVSTLPFDSPSLNLTFTVCRTLCLTLPPVASILFSSCRRRSAT